MRIEESFQQVPPPESNPYTTDLVLPSLVRRLFPAEILQEVEADLQRLGDDLVGPYRALTSKVKPPTLVQYDHWGRRVDDLQTSEGWRALKDAAIREGHVHIPYARKYGEYSRIYGFMKNMLMTGDFHVIMCPLGMTDGAARVIELIGSEEMKREILPRLISTDPVIAYTSGQWMTERPGGSDVSQTETVATPDKTVTSPLGDVYTIDGFKWFSSATEANLAVGLARTGPVSDGTRSLSLFLIPMRMPEIGGPRTPLENGIHVHRLKNKFGTRAVPTAELSINQAKAWLIGQPNGGVKAIASMLNITRIHSAIHSLGNLQRGLAIARSYATVRRVAGGSRLLEDVPLHVAQLAKVSLLYRALTHMIFGAVALLGKAECSVITEEEDVRLRLLTPTAKAFAAELVPSALEECMAALGGQGYMEETGIPRLIRDSLVEKIWEGTINVLSLDLSRATRDGQAISSFITWGTHLIESCPAELREGRLSQSLSTLHEMLLRLRTVFQQPMNPVLPRPALIFFARIVCGLYLLEHAIWSVRNGQGEAENDAECVLRWIQEGSIYQSWEEVERSMSFGKEHATTDRALLFGIHGTSARL